MKAFFKILNTVYVIFTLFATIMFLVDAIFNFSFGFEGLRSFGFSFITYPVMLVLVVFAFITSNLSPLFKIGIPALLLLVLLSLVTIALFRLIKRNKVGLLFAIYILDMVVALIAMIRNPVVSLGTIIIIRIMLIAFYFIMKRKYQG